jgi:hypothetical protein
MPHTYDRFADEPIYENCLRSYFLRILGVSLIMYTAPLGILRLPQNHAKRLDSAESARLNLSAILFKLAKN